jgi:ribosomal protein S18 acetylase RimI-like enzyme
MIKFIRCLERDKPAIWDIFVPAMKPHVENIWGWNAAWQRTEFESHFYRLNTSFVVHQQEKVGYVQYSLNEMDSYLNMIILKPAGQGQQLGNIILNSIQAMQPGKPIKLRCFHINTRAVAFYLKNGFVATATEENFVVLERA